MPEEQRPRDDAQAWEIAVPSTDPEVQDDKPKHTEDVKGKGKDESEEQDIVSVYHGDVMHSRAQE